MNTPTMICIM